MPKTILLIRHAIAQNRREAAKASIADADRQLTAVGKKRWHDAVIGLRKIHGDIDTIFTSPYRRTRETARIISIRMLKPNVDSPTALLFFTSIKAKVIAVVGHEPDLGLLASQFLTKRSSPLIEIKKGGVCCLQLKKRGKSYTTSLQWLLTPSQLAAITCHERHV